MLAPRVGLPGLGSQALRICGIRALRAPGELGETGVKASILDPFDKRFCVSTAGPTGGEVKAGPPPTPPPGRR